MAFCALAPRIFTVLVLSCWINTAQGGHGGSVQQVDFDVIFNCPESCHCPSAEEVDCSEAELLFVPRNISKSTTYLRLNKNRLEFLSSECFFDCPLIRTLDLHRNRLTDEGLTPSTFEPLTHLHHLYLAENQLHTIPRGLPLTLVTLHLAGNLIKRIDPGSLALNRQLRHLYLHNNRISAEGVRRSVFRALSNLEEVTLSNNDFVNFPPLPSAELVYLQNNSITSIPEGVFRRSRKVRLLYLQKNNLSDHGIARKSFAGLRRIEYLDLSENVFTTIPHYLPTRLRRVHLERNKIANISRSAMERLKRVESLLLHQNNIRSSGIESGAFSRLSRLRTLHMYRNDLTTVPDQLPRKLQVLILLSNDISRIGKDTFNTSRRLRHLDMRYNRLTNRGIENGALRKAKSLAVIDLSGNKLRAVPVLPKNLTRLFIISNMISRIPPHSLARVPMLQHLSLANNKLEDWGIPRKVFGFSTHLTTLDLSENFLTEIPKFLPINVEFIYLQRNKIGSISKHAFRLATKLKAINLLDNQLLPETAPKLAFGNLPQLRRIEINWRSRLPDEIKPPDGGKEEKELQRRKRETSEDWLRGPCLKNSAGKCLTRRFSVIRSRKRHRTVP